jgi:hypothetical protein
MFMPVMNYYVIFSGVARDSAIYSKLVDVIRSQSLNDAV